MKPSLVALFIAVLLSACAGHRPHPERAAQIEGTLVGVWCNSNDGGATCWAYDEFRADGTFVACGKTEDDALPFRGEGTYSISGKRMCYVVTRSSANFWLGPGSRYCTEILAISPTAHRYRDLDTGAVFELTRVGPSGQLCETAR